MNIWLTLSLSLIKFLLISTKGQLIEFHMEATFLERPNEKVYYHCEPYFDEE